MAIYIVYSCDFVRFLEETQALKLEAAPSNRNKWTKEAMVDEVRRIMTEVKIRLFFNNHVHVVHEFDWISLSFSCHTTIPIVTITLSHHLLDQNNQQQGISRLPNATDFQAQGAYGLYNKIRAKYRDQVSGTDAIKIFCDKHGIVPEEAAADGDRDGDGDGEATDEEN